MKTHYYLTVFICLLMGTSGAFAKVIRVNNQHPTNATENTFNTLQEAHNFAAAGDTLMIEPSIDVYASVEITKRLVIIGSGYFLDENLETQSTPLQSLVRAITINPGADGTILTGLVFSSLGSGDGPVIKANSVLITRCYLRYGIFIYSSLTSLKVNQNFFPSSTLRMGSSGDSFTDLEFNNNIVVGSLASGFASASIQRTFSSVQHNIFFGSVQITTTSFRSNIIASNTNASQFIINSNNIQNNLTLGNQLTGNGNQLYNANQLFVGEEGNSTDGQYRLKADSPYLTAGYQNAQPGVFGGPTPYLLSGLPSIPVIYELSAETYGSQESGLNIQVKARTNQ